MFADYTDRSPLLLLKLWRIASCYIVVSLLFYLLVLGIWCLAPKGCQPSWDVRVHLWIPLGLSWLLLLYGSLCITLLYFEFLLIKKFVSPFKKKIDVKHWTLELGCILFTCLILFGYGEGAKCHGHACLGSVARVCMPAPSSFYYCFHRILVSLYFHCKRPLSL